MYNININMDVLSREKFSSSAATYIMMTRKNVKYCGNQL